MDFTREPIIETVITPKEGCKLVVRSSKNTAQEEYFVDAIEVVSFGHSFFFRSLERPKSFLVPVSDYEILEVREARMVLKNVGIDRTIKIGGGRDAQMRGGSHREPSVEKQEIVQEEFVASSEVTQGAQGDSKTAEPRIDKKRDRRRQYRRRRGREEEGESGVAEEVVVSEGVEQVPSIELAEPKKLAPGDSSLQPMTTSSILTSLLPPPPTLISETIARYKDNALFRGAFYSKEELKASESEDVLPTISIQQPEYGSFEVSEEEEENIYQERKQHSLERAEEVLADADVSSIQLPQDENAAPVNEPEEVVSTIENLPQVENEEQKFKEEPVEPIQEEDEAKNGNHHQ